MKRKLNKKLKQAKRIEDNTSDSNKSSTSTLSSVSSETPEAAYRMSLQIDEARQAAPLNSLVQQLIVSNREMAHKIAEASIAMSLLQRENSQLKSQLGGSVAQLQSTPSLVASESSSLDPEKLMQNSDGVPLAPPRLVPLIVPETSSSSSLSISLPKLDQGVGNSYISQVLSRNPEAVGLRTIPLMDFPIFAPTNLSPSLWYPPPHQASSAAASYPEPTAAAFSDGNFVMGNSPHFLIAPPPLQLQPQPLSATSSAQLSEYSSTSSLAQPFYDAEFPSRRKRQSSSTHSTSSVAAAATTLTKTGSTRRDRNREAAHRYRSKQNARQKTLETYIQSLNSSNDLLRAEEHEIREQIEQVRHILNRGIMPDCAVLKHAKFEPRNI